MVLDSVPFSLCPGHEIRFLPPYFTLLGEKIFFLAFSS